MFGAREEPHFTGQAKMLYQAIFGWPIHDHKLPNVVGGRVGRAILAIKLMSPVVFHYKNTWGEFRA